MFFIKFLERKQKIKKPKANGDKNKAKGEKSKKVSKKFVKVTAKRKYLDNLSNLVRGQKN